MKQWIFIALGVCCSLVGGLFFAISFFIWFYFDNPYSEGFSLPFVITFLLMIIIGSWMVIRNRKQLRQIEQESLEKRILTAIQANAGQVTAAEVAVLAGCTLEQATAQLDQLCEKGMGELQVTDGGKLVYLFTGFAQASDKATARSPLEP
ncbi:hypothetical protein [Spartinivicinus poritis]|uniref:HTH iclR-type domain-containing protein n=1 Tax=Spartinivicinus poritis TaxID=2994640 RepID=A0ABT5U8F0_9GAMM|nr:hypothetical protein [Spartinivicinus sp. A2-2]MDE1462652.1 hypothetical protein [Spartinivicinus sp. A2-2]